MITGIASGSLILKRICMRVLPIPFAASSTAGSRFVIPVCVLRTIGRSAYTVSAMTAVALPTPENGIRNPSIDMEGIVYRKLITPSVGFAAFWNSLINMPARPPMTTAIRMAISEISRCSHNSPAKKSQRSVKSVPISLNIVIPPFSRSPAPDSSQRTIHSAGSVPAGSCTEFLLQYTAAGSSARTARIRYIHL